MTSVKASKQYSMTVVPHRPYFRLLVILALSITFLLLAICSFLVGRYYSTGTVGFTQGDYADLKQQHLEKIDEVAKLEQQVATLKLATEIDRKANEEVRAQVVELKTQLADMEQKNNFYLSVMQPNAGAQGLIVDAPVVLALPNATGRYSYNVVIKQIVAQHRQLTGYLEFELLGRQQDKLRKLALKDVSDSVNKERIRLGFKYFQRIEGEMVLPEGFVPERIQLKVVVQRPKRAVVDKKFGWLVQES